MCVCLYEGDFIFLWFVPCCAKEGEKIKEAGKSVWFICLVLVVFIFVVQGNHMSCNRKGGSRVDVPDERERRQSEKKERKRNAKQKRCDITVVTTQKWMSRKGRFFKSGRITQSGHLREKVSKPHPLPLRFGCGNEKKTYNHALKKCRDIYKDKSNKRVRGISHLVDGH